MPIGNSIFAVRWQEQSGATVTNVQDYDRGLVFSFATLPDGQFLRMTRTMAIMRPAERLFDDRPQRNKALVLEAMTSLFQRRDASAVERLCAANYIQHNPNIPQGRDALQAIVAELPEHWDVLQSEVVAKAADRGVSMFEPDEATRGTEQSGLARTFRFNTVHSGRCVRYHYGIRHRQLPNGSRNVFAVMSLGGTGTRY